MKILDNINHTVREDLQDTMQKGSRVSIAAACFSIYAYQELKKQLEEIAELRFIFTSPTFVQENTPKERREFYIPKLTREKSLYGTEFEVRLRNELTQKALAKECADWVRRKVKFRSNVSGEQMPGFMTVGESSYMPISGFTTVDLGCERGNNAYYPVQRTEAFENGRYFLSLFDEIWNDSSRLQDVTDIVLQSISTAYRENSPDFIYFFTLYNIFSEFLEDVSEDNLPNEATGFKQSKIWNMLYDFQRDAALAIIHKLEQYNGCILADSVGLGKTFTALAVIKYYENRNKSVLVLCPKKLAANWNIYKGNYVNNPLVEDRFRYDVLYHTDLSRSGGTSNGIDLAALNWGNFDLVVIDESHNFRNGSNTSTDEKENRYTKLMNRVIRSGVRTKVLMLSATPVNNRFVDLKNQLALAYEGDAGKINEKLNTSSPIDEIFRQAQKAFNTWSKLPVTERTTNALLAALDFDFFEVLDSVTIARSRRHIEKYYNISDVGTFPERLKPISVQPCLTSLDNAINYQQIYNVLDSLTLHIYTPTSFILSSRISKYIDPSQHGKGLTQAGREEGIRRLMSINLLKRLESSVYAFRLTIDRISKLIEDTMQSVRSYQNGSRVLELNDISDAADWDDDDQNNDIFTVGRKVKIDLADMDHVSWLHDLEKDAENLELLSLMVQDITPAYDAKLQELMRLIDEKHIFGVQKILDYPKPTRLIEKLLASYRNTKDCVCLDFFSGSATTANAVMQLNAKDGGHRKFIMVQLPEPCDEDGEAYKAGYKNICEIGKERIRRAGEKIKQEDDCWKCVPLNRMDGSKPGDDTTAKIVKTIDAGDGKPPIEMVDISKNPDVGFRVFKLDDTNMKDVYYSAEEYSQTNLEDLESNIKEDRTDLDLLFGCLLDWGLPLSMPYRSEKIDNCTVHTYAPGDAALNVPDALIACFDSNVPENVIKEIAKRKPRRAVFRDSSFASSPEKINVFEIFKLYAPDTDVKVI